MTILMLLIRKTIVHNMYLSGLQKMDVVLVLVIVRKHENVKSDIKRIEINCKKWKYKQL